MIKHILRVVRGGSWRNIPDSLRAADRFGSTPHFGTATSGSGWC